MRGPSSTQSRELQRFLRLIIKVARLLNVAGMALKSERLHDRPKTVKGKIRQTHKKKILHYIAPYRVRRSMGRDTKDDKSSVSRENPTGCQGLRGLTPVLKKREHFLQVERVLEGATPE